MKAEENYVLPLLVLNTGKKSSYPKYMFMPSLNIYNIRLQMVLDIPGVPKKTLHYFKSLFFDVM